MDLGLKGKNVLVTGGSKGIGRAVAELFADEGANVAICARNAEDVDKVAKALAGKHVKAWGRALDVADPAALKAWVDDAATELGGIDAIVCNVSALAVGDTAETWEKSFRTDMMHTVNAVAAAMPYLEKSKVRVDRHCLQRLGFRGRFCRRLLRRLQGRTDPLRQRPEQSAHRQRHSGQCGIAGQYLFRRRHLAEHRARPPRPLQDSDGRESDRSDGHAARSRRRRGVPGEPRGQPHFRHQSHHRRRADQGGLGQSAGARKAATRNLGCPLVLRPGLALPIEPCDQFAVAGFACRKPTADIHSRPIVRSACDN